RELSARGLDREIDGAGRAHRGAGAVDGDRGWGLAPRPDPGASGAHDQNQDQKAQQLFHGAGIVLRVFRFPRKIERVERLPSRGSMSEGWYRYGDSNPGPVAENHVS